MNHSNKKAAEASTVAAANNTESYESAAKHSNDPNCFSQEDFESIGSGIVEGFTKVDNLLLEYGITLFSPSEFKVFMFIWRKLPGWNKYSDRISYSQFVERTGLTMPTVRRAIEGLVLRGLIRCTPQKYKRGHHAPSAYRINYDVLNKVLIEQQQKIKSTKGFAQDGQNNEPGSEGSIQRVVKKTDRSGKNPLPTKDTLSKRNSLKDPCLKETSSSSSPSSLEQWKKEMLLDGWDEDVCDAALTKYYLQPPGLVQNPRGWLKPVLQSRKDDKQKEERVKEIHAKNKEQEEIARKNAEERARQRKIDEENSARKRGAENKQWISCLADCDWIKFSEQGIKVSYKDPVSGGFVLFYEEKEFKESMIRFMKSEGHSFEQLDLNEHDV